MQKVQLIPIKEDERASIRSRTAYCKLPSYSTENCLVAVFSGVIEETDSHESGYGYMHAMIGDGFAACNPATLILDLRGLRYETGDRMLKILDQRIITKVIISDLNKDGLSNLISSILFLSPPAELFESLEGGLNACDAAYDKLIREGRKKLMASDF